MTTRFVSTSGSALKTRGWKRCIMAVRGKDRPEAKEFKCGQRLAVSLKGARCGKLVSPEMQKLYGAEVCASHLPQYLELIHKSVNRKADLRRRLDPGCAVE